MGQLLPQYITTRGVRHIGWTALVSNNVQKVVVLVTIHFISIRFWLLRAFLLAKLLTAHSYLSLSSLVTNRGRRHLTLATTSSKADLVLCTLPALDRGPEILLLQIFDKWILSGLQIILL